MKKLSFLLIIVTLLLVASSPAFALNCKTSQSGNSDECWTEVRISGSEIYVVSQGTVLVYDLGGDDPYYQVRVASASTDHYKVAGVAQRIIATGDTALVQVRGYGKVRVGMSAVTSGDRLYTSNLVGTLSPVPSGGDVNSSKDGIIAYATAASTTGIGAKDAFITIV